MALITITDAEGVDHLVHTSQIEVGRPTTAADAWIAVWEKFNEAKTEAAKDDQSGKEAR